MPYFGVFSHPQLPLVRAAVLDRRPKAVDRDGFHLRYVAEVSQDSVAGAETILMGLDNAMGDATKGPGVYQAKYEDVRERLQRLFDDAPKQPGRHPLLKGAAWIGIALCVLWMACVGPWAMIIWLIVCAFRSQSGLMTMAETAVVWSIFDTRPLIARLKGYIDGNR